MNFGTHQLKRNYGVGTSPKAKGDWKKYTKKLPQILEELQKIKTKVYVRSNLETSWTRRGDSKFIFLFGTNFEGYGLHKNHKKIGHKFHDVESEKGQEIITRLT